MPGIRNAVVGIALGSALLFQPVHAASSAKGPPEPDTPPAEWAEYIAQVKAADKVQGDEVRCKAHPDLPGNQWRPGAAQGRCSLLRAPVYTLDQIDALLADVARYRVRSDGCFPLVADDETSPSTAADGYWLLIKPLAPGRHTLTIGANYAADDDGYGRMVQNFEYVLHVGGRTEMASRPSGLDGPLVAGVR